MKFREIFTLIFILVFSLAASAAEPLKSGSYLPSFELPDQSSQILKFDSFLGSKPVLLVFFTTWSKTCVSEIEYLKSLHQIYRDQLVIVAVSFDRKAADVENFIREQKINYPVLLDKKGKYIADFQILVIPKLFLTDSSGLILKIYNDFDENIENLLAADLLQLFSKSKDT